jgi:phosphoglycolate phosphatase
VNFPLLVRAVVIDLDGTLLDSAPDLGRAANRMLAEVRLPALELDVIKSFIGNGITNLVKRSLSTASGETPSEDYFAHALDIFSRHYEDNLSHDTQPYPGVVEGIAMMRDAGIRLGCVTNKAERFTSPLLQETGLSQFFDLTICGDTLPEKKPHPLPLLHACNHFGVSPNELLMIGDSANDTETARRAGCPVFCVSYGYSGGRDVAEFKPDAIVESLVEAARLIERRQG